MMGFVDDEVTIFREGTVVHGDISQQESMVDDDEMCALGLLPCSIEETAASLAVFALLCNALVRGGV
jgi:hypothetical protein